MFLVCVGRTIFKHYKAKKSFVGIKLIFFLQISKRGWSDELPRKHGRTQKFPSFVVNMVIEFDQFFHKKGAQSVSERVKRNKEGIRKFYYRLLINIPLNPPLIRKLSTFNLRYFISQISFYLLLQSCPPLGDIDKSR